jgi:hypothetical protein
VERQPEDPRARISSDPTQALKEVISGDRVPLPARTAEGLMPTPPALAAHIVDTYADIQSHPLDDMVRVLEPSAGGGALVQALLKAHPAVRVTAVEPDAQQAAQIPRTSRVEIFQDMFESFAARAAECFDVVVMNPPFAKPGHHVLWKEHVTLAWNLLAPGGRLVAVVPNGFTFRQDRHHTGIRQLIEKHGGYTELDKNAFGNQLQTVVVWADKPADPAPMIH